ncbi:MAG: Succinyl-diaminopimelate desuccinylase [Chlamydiae bacterium]|nr:Succinyl-diaminopimelate desuccinylase [Chlamydiota bacterium]
MNTLRVTNSQFSAAIESLKQLVAFPSVSNTDSPDYSAQYLDDAAHFIESELKELGFDVRCEQINDSPLFVLGSRKTDATRPTILMYGHYDVQPVDRAHWDSDPFKMEEKNGRLYGRGASDDKVGIVVILAALRAFKEAGKEPNFNLKVLFEGEEEFGSNNMGALLKDEGKDLTSDVLIVFDGINKDVDTGTIQNSTRGVLTMTLKVDALTKPTHSGMGCLAPDPAQALAGLIYSLRDPRAIMGFMEDCVYASHEEIRLLDASSRSEEEFKSEHGVVDGGKLRGNPEYSISHRILDEPSISIINMTCGKPNGGNSIQSSAECTVGVRLTAGQDPEKIEHAIRDHLASQPVMWDLPFTFTRTGLSARSWKTDATEPYATKYLQAMGSYYPRTAVMPMGGTIPFLENVFSNMEIFIVGVEDPDTSAHSHNESQSILVFRRAIDSLITFLLK